jgi:hypothetical protein
MNNEITRKAQLKTEQEKRFVSEGFKEKRM